MVFSAEQPFFDTVSLYVLTPNALGTTVHVLVLPTSWLLSVQLKVWPEA